MRLWPVRRGKIDRKQFRETFGLNSDFIVRYPKLRALLEEFDARVVNEDYRSRRVDSELQRLKDVLDAGPALNRDRLKVNRPALVASLGIPLGRLWQSPFVEEIRLHKTKILHRAKEGVIDPFLAGRVLVFSDLSPHWGVPFLVKIGAQFSKAFLVISGTRRDFEILTLHFLIFWTGLVSPKTRFVGR